MPARAAIGKTRTLIAFKAQDCFSRSQGASAKQPASSEKMNSYP
jgi:hypothetical protein